MDGCFEDKTGQSPEELSKDDFNSLSDDLKWLAYENLLEMFYGVSGELEESYESFISKLKIMSGTGNGIGAKTIKKIENIAKEQGLIERR